MWPRESDHRGMVKEETELCRFFRFLLSSFLFPLSSFLFPLSSFLFPLSSFTFYLPPSPPPLPVFYSPGAVHAAFPAGFFPALSPLPRPLRCKASQFPAPWLLSPTRHLWHPFPHGVPSPCSGTRGVLCGLHG